MFCSGYTKFRMFTDDERKLLEEAIKGLVGVNYEPIAVTTQVVSGIDYKFFCNKIIITPYGLEEPSSGPNKASFVTVYKDTQEPHN